MRYNKILSKESYNWIVFFTLEWERRLSAGQCLRYAKRKYRRFWTALNCRRSDKCKGQFRLWISKPVTWMWSHHRRREVYPFCGKSVRICVPAFFVARKPVTTEWPAGRDMTVRWSPFDGSEHSNAAVRLRGRDRKTTFRQTGKTPTNRTA